MDIQRLRNLTTERLHTEMAHIYQDIEHLTGMQGLKTPNANRALQPYLLSVAPDPRLWDGEYDLTHTGDIAIEPMGEVERKAFMERYEALDNPLMLKRA